MKKPERGDGFGMNKWGAFDHQELCIVENVEFWFKIMIICKSWLLLVVDFVHSIIVGRWSLVVGLC